LGSLLYHFLLPSPSAVKREFLLTSVRPEPVEGHWL
jgi:hypothetical protein